MHRNSLLLFKKYALPLVERNVSWLEVSPASFPSAYWKLGEFSGVWHSVGLEEDSRLTYQGEPYVYPIATNAYDVVVSGQVIEHVAKPWLWVKELARVVKPGGMVVTIGPVTWPYHEAPIDCWRIYPDGMHALYHEAGLDPILAKAESLDRHAPYVVDTIAIGEKV